MSQSAMQSFTTEDSSKKKGTASSAKKSIWMPPQRNHATFATLLLLHKKNLPCFPSISRTRWIETFPLELEAHWVNPPMEKEPMVRRKHLLLHSTCFGTYLLPMPWLSFAVDKHCEHPTKTIIGYDYYLSLFSHAVKKRKQKTKRP